MLSLLALAFFAQPQRVTGQVVPPVGSELNRNGISCAIVEAGPRTLFWSGEISLDADGRFTVDLGQVRQRLSARVRDRPLEFWIRRDPVHRVLHEPWIGCAFLPLPDGVPAEDCDLGVFALGTAPVTICGVARDTLGVPQGGLKVRLCTGRIVPHSYEPGKMHLQTLAETLCDENGKFIFRELLPEDANFDQLALVAEEPWRQVTLPCQPGDEGVELIVPAAGKVLLRHAGLPEYAEAELELVRVSGNVPRTQSFTLSHGENSPRTDAWPRVAEGEYRAIVHTTFGGLWSLRESQTLGWICVEANQTASVAMGAIVEPCAPLQISKLYLIDEEGQTLDPLKNPAELNVRGVRNGKFKHLSSVDLLPHEGGYLLMSNAIQRRLGPKGYWSDGVVRIDGYQGVVWSRLNEETTLCIRRTPWRKIEIIGIPESVDAEDWSLWVKQSKVRPGLEESPIFVKNAWPHPYILLASSGEYQLRWTRSWPDGGSISAKAELILTDASEDWLEFPHALDSEDARSGHSRVGPYRSRTGDRVPPGGGAPASLYPIQGDRAIPIWSTMYPSRPSTPPTPSTPPAPTRPPLPLGPPRKGEGKTQSEG